MSLWLRRIKPTFFFFFSLQNQGFCCQLDRWGFHRVAPNHLDRFPWCHGMGSLGGKAPVDWRLCKPGVLLVTEPEHHSLAVWEWADSWRHLLQMPSLPLGNMHLFVAIFYILFPYSNSFILNLHLFASRISTSLSPLSMKSRSGWISDEILESGVSHFPLLSGVPANRVFGNRW